MSIFSNIGDWLFGNTDQSQQTNIVEDADVQSSQIETQQQAGSTQTGSVTQAEFLGEQERAALSNLLFGVANQAQGVDTTSTALQSLALGTPGTLASNVNRIMQGARANTQRELDARNAALSRSAGAGATNTVVNREAANNMANAEALLAATEGQLVNQAALGGIQGLSTALAGVAEGQRGLSGSAAAIGDVLRGATARTETSQVENTINQIAKVLETLTQGRTVRAGETESDRSGSLFDILRLNYQLGG